MMNTIATSIVLILAGGLVAIMIYVIKLSSDDSGKQSELKQFVEALFGGSSARQEQSAEQESAAARLPDDANPFQEPCPACGEIVTHRDVDCPSCGLRLV
ncbi:zinc ribbon domain-containing protein [Paenibacillus sp. R14(2021)]|uniref:zinc ribbon domain-containing protein n=1 Tax=Paenibacillus sp. R14(2021) TaxID=2859228 RepID=UPI001C616428|nr:zinc ribbon domain-containing protein [Paenibacillus sp. R14(2021)]